jgi:membrane-bound lytic murein transglycosylase B
VKQIIAAIIHVFFWLLFAAIGAPPLSAAEPSIDFNSLQNRLIKDGFKTASIRQIYRQPGVAFEARGVSLFFVHRESKLNYGQFTDQASLASARSYMEKRGDALARAEADYGVDKHVITAILLVESRFGKYIGKRSAFNTLSTMAALDDPAVRKKFWEYMSESHRISRKRFEKKADRKSGWAYRELKALLKYAAHEGLDPVAIKGSYAGAVGLPQFMPSNILKYGGDGDQDGVINLETHDDAVASIAKYLKGHGWHPGLTRQKAKKVIYRYNHSTYYVNTILKIADLLKG